MNGTKNSISSLVSQFLRLQKNALEIINGLNEVAVSTNDTVAIEVLDESGNPKNVNIPSYGYIKGEIERLDNNVKSLSGIGDTSATVRNSDGTYSQIYKSESLTEPNRITNIILPNSFGIKNNWFFENFLSPLLYINLDVTNQVSDNADRILVKRIIANTTTDEQKKYFDTNIKGKNDISYESLINMLIGAGIGYFVDEDIIQLPLRSLRYTGSFSVLNYYDDLVNITDPKGNVIQETKRNYKLDKLTYSDNQSNIKNSMTLEIGNTIMTKDGSTYQITSVNKDQSSIQAKRISGYEHIMLGANTISITSTDFGARMVNVNVGYDERQCIFLKNINDNFNIVGSTWSTGVAFWSNELQTKNSSGNIVTLEEYYLSEVSDFGKIFLGAAKEKKIPAIEGLAPDAPVITEDNFKVVQINKQVTNSTSISSIEEKIALKSTLKSEISELDTAIAQAKLQLNTGLGSINDASVQLLNNRSDNSILSNNLTPSDITKQKNTPIGVNIEAVKVNLSTLIDERIKKLELHNSLVSEIDTLSLDVPQITTSPKYRVRGFWPIPAAKTSAVGPQEVIQFIIKYRYLNDNGASIPTEQIEFADIDGIKKTGAFSNWIEYKTDIRKKTYDTTTGFYRWNAEDTSNSDITNINQLDLAITKGERIEIKIASVSEAGWPDNPIVSEFSTPITIAFPENLSVAGITSALKTNTEDAAVTKMQAQLNAQGLSTHLSEQFMVGNNTFYHNPASIPSGFYNNNGNIISLFDKLNDLQNQLTLLKSQITQAKGILEVYIIDKNNNKVKVSKGSTVKLNAGFYNEIYPNSTTTDAGKIASISYNIQLFNSVASPVELSSIIPGGLELKAPSSSSAISGYDINLRYGDIPVSLSSYTIDEVLDSKDFRQIPPYASCNTYSQYIYPRYRNIGYNQVLYLNPNTVDLNQWFTTLYDPAYSYDGDLNQINFGVSGKYPQNGTILSPYDPTKSAEYASVAGSANASVWNGTYTSSTGGTPVGNGAISEFCIHKDHPYLKSIGESNAFTTYIDLIKPYSTNGVNYSPFRHAQTFWADTSLPQHWVQQSYRTPIDFAIGATAPREDNMYSDKLGFSSNDEYLIGKYSCGAYLFLNPVNTQSLQVPGTTSLSTVYLEEGEVNAINIPIVYQFRAVDKLGNIGGWRKSGTLSNITYTKKVGIDIQIKNMDAFSFDIQITGSYKNDTLVAPNFDSGIKVQTF